MLADEGDDADDAELGVLLLALLCDDGVLALLGLLTLDTLLAELGVLALLGLLADDGVLLDWLEADEAELWLLTRLLRLLEDELTELSLSVCELDELDSELSLLVEDRLELEIEL